MKLYIIITTLSFLCIESGIQFAVGSPLSENYMNGLHKFCGQALKKELSELCMGRYDDPQGTTNQRGKRAVADECCSRPCSRNYMKINFCHEPEVMKTDSAVLIPLEDVDYIGYYFELLGRILAPKMQE
ncbi:bombyxin B-6-like [Aphis gossypii]|uniref:Insulin-like domain-containing protein n=1 Tax=Aphis gossypii TaxID=80765 RepID=A0A9P0J821_APHGO|nr:bombyxin B-6-like [Aphis gossypii]CAH1732113.1 unnamed protein product [Aphis gossypii]